MPAGDTIVALSSPPGSSFRAVVRASGPEALALADRLFAPETGPPPSAWPGFRHGAGRLRLPDLPAPAVLYVMRAPRSYTREDVVEFHLPGAAPLVRALLEACLAAGARSARPGEFTRRAYESGRIDLAQAEAVAALVRARDESARRRSIAVLAGGLSRKIEGAARSLRHVQALLVAAVDFSDQDLGGDVESQAAVRLAEAAAGIESIRAEGREEIGGDRGLRVQLVGRANSGKSSLYNRLLGAETAIVTPVPGTTRDLIEADLVVGGARFVLVDGAGVRDDGEERAPLDRSAEERSARAREEADLFLHVVDGSLGVTDADRRLHDSLPATGIWVVSKADLPGPGDLVDLPGAVRVSSTTGEGLAVLGDLLVEAASGGGAGTGSATVLGARQADALRRAAAHVADSRRALEGPDLGPEFAAVDVESALAALGEIVGEVTHEEVLDLVFSRFCIGK